MGSDKRGSSRSAEVAAQSRAKVMDVRMPADAVREDTAVGIPAVGVGAPDPGFLSCPAPFFSQVACMADCRRSHRVRRGHPALRDPPPSHLAAPPPRLLGPQRHGSSDTERSARSDHSGLAGCTCSARHGSMALRTRTGRVLSRAGRSSTPRNAQHPYRTSWRRDLGDVGVWWYCDEGVGQSRIEIVVGLWKAHLKWFRAFCHPRLHSTLIFTHRKIISAPPLKSIPNCTTSPSFRGNGFDSRFGWLSRI